MGEDANSRRAVDNMTKRIVEHARDAKGGKLSEEAARKEAIKIAKRTDREKGWD